MFYQKISTLRFLTWVAVVLTVTELSAKTKLTVYPTTIRLTGKKAYQQLLVNAGQEGHEVDVTGQAKFRSVDPKIAQVTKDGRVESRGDGKGKIVVEVAGQTAEVTVEAVRSMEVAPISFELIVQPILVNRGCSTGACHGKARGQNGFQLSLLGFDPEFDFAALTREGRGRRLFPADPPRSLLLQKATGQIAHGGGIRLPAGSEDCETVLRWIAEGAQRQVAGEPQLERISLYPGFRMMKPQEEQGLLVTAYYSDGTERDVTSQTQFQSNESVIVGVPTNGRMRAGPIPGEATIMARFMGSIATCNVVIPLEGKVPAELYTSLPQNNFIDGLVWKKLQLLGITPSQGVTDAAFMRRVSVDILGRLPSAEEARAFLADGRADKRARLVDALLQRPEYVDHWASKWMDLLRPNPYRVGIKAVLNYDNWIRESFRQNKPYDQFVTDLVTAQGSTWRNGAATLFRDRRSPDEITTMVSQLFLGVRLECAKCHHHPFEKWSQEDFYSLAAYFSRVGRKGTGLSPPISGGEEIIMLAKSGTVRHPISNEELAPRPLFGDAVVIPETEDPRSALVQWMTSPENNYFAEVIVNRIWADLMGRGLVEPVDDLRITNPPSNGPLLEALAGHLREQRFDLKKLIGTIAKSHVYALSTVPTERNVSDTRNYSRFYRQRLRAEVLLDAITDITEVSDSFSAMPPQSRANQIWTTRVSSLFLDTFGRPNPNQDPPCERMPESTVVQTLHLMNAPNLHNKLTTDAGFVARMAASKLPSEKIVEELYLRCYTRLPTAEELVVGQQVFEQSKSNRRQATEDLLWALMNTPEFVFKN